MTTTEPDITPTQERTAGGFPIATTAQRAIPILIAALVVLVDQLSKLPIETTLPLHSSWAPLAAYGHLLRFTHVSNTGAAFGLFPGASQIFTLIAVVVTLVITVYNYSLPRGYRLLRLGLGLQVGGALGNLIDRLRLGHVTDFLDVGPLPVFNLADVSIVTGVVVLGVLILFEHREMAASEQAMSSQTLPAALPSQRQNEQAT